MQMPVFVLQVPWLEQLFGQLTVETIGEEEFQVQ